MTVLFIAPGPGQVFPRHFPDQFGEAEGSPASETFASSVCIPKR
jgi:hypothetical protein